MRYAVRLKSSAAWPNRTPLSRRTNRIEFRIGIHVGDIIIDDNDIFGDGVNVAARLEGIAEPGGVCISNDAYRQIRGKVEIGCDDMGPQTPQEHRRAHAGVASSARRIKPPRQPNQASTAGEPSRCRCPTSLLSRSCHFRTCRGDPEQEYFADGLVEDIITELSRFREFAVIARNSTFFYKGKPLDVTQVARDLGVRYVLEGSVRKIGNRVRVTAQLIDAVTNDHLWAERYDREQADVFDVQEEITRTVVSNIAPQIELAEIARSRRSTANLHARHLAWRAGGLYLDAYNGGNAALMQQAITACEKAIAADPSSLAAHFTLAVAHSMCHLYRWGDRPGEALGRAWEVVERMTAINSQDERTLTIRGMVRVNRGEYDGGLADLRRAYQINPNYAGAIIVLAYAEATTGLAREAEAHAQVAIRLVQRTTMLGPPTSRWQWHTSRCATTTKLYVGVNPQSKFRIERRSVVPS